MAVGYRLVMNGGFVTVHYEDKVLWAYGDKHVDSQVFGEALYQLIEAVLAQRLEQIITWLNNSGDDLSLDAVFIADVLKAAFTDD